LFYGFAMINGKYMAEGSFEPLFEALSEIDEISSKYKSELSERSFSFITNEMKSYFYCGIFSLASVIENRHNYTEDGLFNESEIAQYFPLIDKIDIHKNYNEYGLYSRKSASEYLGYHFTKANKIRPLYITSRGFRFTPETELKMQFARLVLTGSPYYREIASTLSEILVRRGWNSRVTSRTPYATEVALENFELMIKLCNDKEITDEAKYIVSQYRKLQKEDYLPKMEFLDLEGKTISINDFKGDKPTIFNFTNTWTAGRYNYDDLASQNPQYNFIMVVDGSSHKQWAEYTKRAEPVAKQLLLLNDSTSISELFQKGKVYFVLNKNGELESYAKNEKSAIQIAEDSLEVKKKN